MGSFRVGQIVKLKPNSYEFTGRIENNGGKVYGRIIEIYRDICVIVKVFMGDLLKEHYPLLCSNGFFEYIPIRFDEIEEITDDKEKQEVFLNWVL